MIVNGKQYDFEEISIEELLNKLNLNKDKVVVEVNLDIIRKIDYKERVINKEDTVEIVAFVGGG
ncbi:MAG: sulfur carrier protein ThiS [Sarcina sp.]